MNARSLFVAAALVTGSLLSSAARAGAVTPMPNALAFPGTGVGAKSSSMNVQFTNTSGASVNIDTVVLGGANGADYQIVGNLGLPILLPPGVPLSVDVIFFPQTAGVRTATLSAQVRNQMGTTDVALTGTALGPKIVIKPTPIIAGGLTFGTPVPPLTITCTNGGGSTLNIPSAPTITGINANLFSMSGLPSFPQALTPGVNFTFQITFTPMMAAKVFAILNINSDDPMNPMLGVPITGLAGDPVVALDVGAVFFGNERVNQVAQAQTINISNTGLSDLHVSAITVIGNNKGDFPLQSVPKQLPVTIAAGASLPITVAFAPTAAGSRSASIQISTDDPKTPQKLLQMTGTGTTPAGVLAPLMVDFGTVRLGTAPTTAVTLTNTGTGPITVTGNVIAGPGAAQYSVAPIATMMAPVVVPGGGHQDFTITFKPAKVAAYTATITFITDDPNLLMAPVTIMGQGTSPVFGLMPMTLDFGSVPVGMMSPPKTFAIGNTGNTDLIVKSMVIAGPSSTRFNMTMAQTPFMIPMGGSMLFSVVYGPLDPSSDNAVVNIATDDPNMLSGQVMLLGIGQQANMVVTPPDMIDFMSVTVGGARMLPLKIQNTGDAALVISSFKFMGMAGYTADTKTPFTVAPGKTTTVQILFQPTAPGTIAAMLEIDPMDNGIMPVTINLTGVATASMISAAPMSLDFGMVPVGTASTRQEIKIFNGAGSSQTFTMPVSDDPHFALDLSAFSKTIAGGGVASVFVTFNPDAPGMITSRIKFALAGSPSTIAAQVFLTGNGAAAAGDMGMPAMTPARGCAVSGAHGGSSGAAGLAGLGSLLALALVLRRRRHSV